ncbi:MAG TPA: MG2 domain-containing protein [bacterium]|nr:MG2 domain-containing protein [bacterium]
MKRVVVLLAMLLAAVAGLNVSVASKPAAVQDVFISAPDELDPGSPAAFRVVVMEATGLQESRPLQGADVEVWLIGKGVNKRLIKARTDRDGTVSESARVPDVPASDDYELAVRVSSALGQVEKKHAAKLAPHYNILLSLDKPLYQPGQLIHMRAVALRLADLRPVAKTRVTIEVEDPQGNKVFKKLGDTDAYGIFSGDFQLADEIRLGDYTVRAKVGDREVERMVTIKRYVLPKFKVTLDTNKQFYRPGEKLTGTVKANYFFGKPIDGGQVKVTAQAFDFEFHAVAEAIGKTDASGNFEFEITLPDYFAGQPLEQGDAFVKLDAEVTDNAKHSETAMVQRKVASADLRLELVPEAGRLIPGVENRIYAVVTTPDDQPVAATVKLSVTGKEFNVPSDDTGIAEFFVTPKAEDFKRAPDGKFSLPVTASAQDKQGRRVEVSRELSADNLRDNVLLSTDRAIYTAGNDMNVTVLSTMQKGSVYLDVIKNTRTVLTRSLEFSDGKAAERVAIGPDLFGTIELHAYVILPSGEIMRDTKVIYVEQSDDLNIAVSLDKDTYRPGEEARLVFKVTDKKGQGHAAALGVSVVDESVFAIQDMQPGLLKVYFTLEKELAKPRYEIHFAPGGQSVESLIQDRGDAMNKRDKVMRVLLAGVEKPTAPGWEENPAKDRMQKEQQNFQTFAYSFFTYAYAHPFLEKARGGKWQYKKDVAAQMVADKALDKQYAYDSFGSPYDPAMLTTLDPALDLNTVAGGVASYRIMMIYNGLQNYYGAEQQSWLDKMFEGGELKDLPPDIMDALVEKKYLDQAMSVDPWGKGYIVKRLDKPAANPYSDLFKYYEIKSAGPDGKAGTGDDVSDPYLYARLPYLNQMGWGGGWEDEGRGGWKLMRALGAAGDVMMKEQAMAMPAMAPPASGEAPRKANGGKDGDKAAPGIRVREYFPETLWWAPALITDPFGKASLTIPMADSITTWRLTALGHSSDGLVGSAASGIRVFQDFFVDIDFPVALTQGDEVEVPVAVYNYLPGSQRITLEVREHDGFDLLSESKQTLTLSSGQVDVRYFRVKAIKVGKHTLTVYAVGSKMSDAIKRSVDVVPNGLRMEVVRNGRITGPLAETIEVPEFAINDASRVMVKIYPGVFASVVEGLDGIFRMPSGCFEQTTSITYPNVMVLAYMKKSKIIKPDLQMKAEGFINLGYQRLLSFEVPGGGFEWFGNPPANKVLTAYGLMEFSDMSKVYNIDETVITRTQNWLASQQEKDGSWKPVEHWLETLSGDDFSRSTELNTAYIAWALADTGYKGEATQKAIAYLKANLKNISDAYTLALAVNALVSANRDDADAKDLLRRLDGIKIEDQKTGTIHWEPKGKTAVNGDGRSASIETTSLILYAMVKAGMYAPTVNKGLAWISQQKDAFGTFQSTQATVLSMKALLAAEEGKAPNVRGDVVVSLKDRKETVSITPENSDVLRLIDFKDQTATGRHTVDLQAPPDLGLMYQVVGIYYVPWDRVKKMEQKPLLSLDLKYDRAKLKADDLLTASVTAAYHGDKATDMVILDLGIPPGFSLVPDALDRLKGKNTIEKYTATGRQITVYVRRMEAGKPLTFSYQLKAKFPVKAQTPKSTVYEYYNPDRKAEVKPVPIEVTK